MWLYLALLTVFYLIGKHFYHKLQNLPPSPFPTFPILGHLHLMRQPIHRNLTQLAAKNGSILYLRLGFTPVLLLSSPSAVEECLHKSDTIFANRPDLAFAKIIGYNNTIFLWAPYGDLWRSLRRICTTEILTTRRLHMLAGIRVHEVRSLLIRINDQISPAEGGEDRNLNVASLFFETVNNVMLRMIAGKRYYGEDEVTEEGRRFRDLIDALKNMETFFGTEDFFPILRRFTTGRLKKLKSAFAKGDEFFQDLVEQHRRRRMEGEKGEGSLIEVLLSLQEKDPGFITDEIIKGQALVMLFAGADTSTGTMEWALSLLLNHPNILKKAQSEIDEVVGHKRLIEESDLDHLPYLHNIINEALRMYPPVPLMLKKASRACEIEGYKVPADTMVLVNAWGVQNDPKVWDEPEKFKPERFQEVDHGRRSLGLTLIPFGAGRRACPGEALGLKMVGLVLGSMLQCFEWERPGKELIDMEERSELTLAKANPLMAKCTPRQHMIKLLFA